MDSPLVYASEHRDSRNLCSGWQRGVLVLVSAIATVIVSAIPAMGSWRYAPQSPLYWIALFVSLVATVFAAWIALRARKHVPVLIAGVLLIAAAYSPAGAWWAIDTGRIGDPVVTSPVMRHSALALIGLAALLLLVPSGVLFVREVMNSRKTREPRIPAPAPAPGVPMAFTVDGRPVYPIVGHTPEGQPVRSDQVAGLYVPGGRTNSLAIAALVLGLVFPLAAIPIGHIARAQIRRTGEQGRGLALTGLILGYLSVAAIAIVWIAVVVVLRTSS